jgi:hypothetical protein
MIWTMSLGFRVGRVAVPAVLSAEALPAIHRLGDGSAKEEASCDRVLQSPATEEGWVPNAPVLPPHRRLGEGGWACRSRLKRRNFAAGSIPCASV